MEEQKTQHGTKCDCSRCEMAYRAWQQEAWEHRRVSNSDAIYVFGFKSRVDMEKAWQEAGLAEMESNFKYQIGERAGMRG